MGWRSTGAAFRAGNYSGPLTSDEGGFASGFAKTFTAGISKASDIIAGEMQAERDQEREKDLIRLRETLAAQRAAATAARKTEKEDSEALAWALDTVKGYGLAASPENITRLTGLFGSEGGAVQAGNALDDMIVSGALTLAPTDTATTAPEVPAPATLGATVLSQNTTELPSVSTQPPAPLDDLEATDTTNVTNPEPVEVAEPEVVDESVTPEPVAPQPVPIDFVNLTGGQASIIRDLRTKDTGELRLMAETTDPNSFQGRAARQLYQDSRTREIMQMTDETTLRTILNSGSSSEWEKEAARAVVSNMSNPVGLVRVQLDDGTFVMARQGRNENADQQFVDTVTGQPIDQIAAVIDPSEDGATIDRAMSQLSRANSSVTDARTTLRGYIAAADAAFKMTEILARNESILTFTGGVIPATISRIESELEGINSLFGEEGQERNLDPEQVFARFEYLEREANDLFNNGQIDQAARDRAIYQAQEKRLAYIVARSQQGPAGVISNQDYNSALESVRASVNAGTFEESLRKLILADETAVRIGLDQAASDDFVRAAQTILDQQGVDFPLVQDLFRTIPENFERYGVGDAYQWLQGEINLAQGQTANLPPLGDVQPPPRLIDRSATELGSPSVAGQSSEGNVVVRETTLNAMRRYIEEKGGTEISRQAAVDVILENTPGLTEDQLRQAYPEFFPNTSE